MAPRRNTTPLFEIVNRNGNAPAVPTDRSNPAAEAAHIEPKTAAPSRPEAPARRARSSEHDAQTERLSPGRPSTPTEIAPPVVGGSQPIPSREPDAREVPRTMGRISVAAGTMRLPVNYAYIAVSGVLVFALIAWTLGYMFGGRNADEKARREIESATGSPVLRDPLEEGAPGTSMPPPGTTPASILRSDVPRPITSAPQGGTPLAESGLPAVTSQRTGFLAPGGFFEAEPRQAGLNYLCLISRIPEADAIRAIDFLARNGVVAVGVEPPRTPANNRIYALYTLQGLTRDEYARENGSDRRDAHEALVAELGRRWKAEERGTSDFSRPQWYRFNPS